MVYIDNILDEQHVYIPRNDNQGSYESSYDKGYSDGYSDGIEDCESCPLQDKEVILTAVTETITADEGYAGIERVFVDGRQLAAEKYVEGYNDGEENGVQEQKGKLASTAFTQNGVYTREDGWNEVEVDVPLSGLLQQKVLGLESGDTSPWVVTPDSGYNGMTQVIVNDSGYGQGKYDDGYTSGSTDGYNQGYESGYTSGVTDGYSSGYTSGVTDGENAVYANMSSTAFTQNDTYQNPSGWSSVTVNVPKNVNLGTLVDAPAMQELNNGYYDKSFVPSEGSSDGWGRVYLDLNYIIEGGKDEQKALLSSTAFTQNDTYQNPSGWSSVTVNVPKNVELGTLVDFIAMNKLHNGYYEATFDRDNPWTDGWGAVQLNTDTLVLEAKAEQKALLSSTAITQNGNYTREDGWSAVSVSVTPQLQGKNESLTAVTQTFVPDSGYVGMSAVTVDASALTQDYYDSGYTSGQTDGYSSGYTDGLAKECNIEATKNVAITAVTQSILPSSVVPSWLATIYGGNLTDFNDAVSNSSNGKLTIDMLMGSPYLMGWFTESNGELIFHDDRGNVDYVISTDLPLNEWTPISLINNVGVYAYYDTYNLWFSCNYRTLSLACEETDINNLIFDSDKFYDGMAQVNVNARAIYDSGYTNGYDEGVIDGVEAQKALMVSTAITQNGTYTRADGWDEIEVIVPTRTGSTCNLQTKFYTVTGSSATLRPDNGYDGFEAVQLNAGDFMTKCFYDGVLSVVDSFFTGNTMSAYSNPIVVAYYYTPIDQNCLICGYECGDLDVMAEYAFEYMSVDGGAWERRTRFYTFTAGWHQIRFTVKDSHLECAFAHNMPDCFDCYMDALVAVSLPNTGLSTLYRTFQNNTGLKILSSSLTSFNDALNGASNLKTIYSHYTGNNSVVISGTGLSNSGVLYYPTGKSSNHTTPSNWTKIELL